MTEPVPPARPRQDEVTGVRQLILRRAQEVGITLADLSRAAGFNASYIHQYIWKATPKRLDEETRRILAKHLQLDEELLRETPRPMFTAPAPSAAIPPTTPVTGALLRQVPLFREADAFEPTEAQQWAPPFQAAMVAATCAVWIDRPHARLRPGDIAYTKGDQPVRQGDLIVALNADRRIAAIGEIVALDGETVTVEGVIPTATYARKDFRLLKIIGILLP